MILPGSLYQRSPIAAALTSFENFGGFFSGKTGSPEHMGKAVTLTIMGQENCSATAALLVLNLPGTILCKEKGKG